VRYAIGCITALLQNGKRAVDCRLAVYEDYNARLASELDSLVFSHAGAGSWYKNKAGRVVNTSPWRLVDYWKWTRRPELADYDML
jgi:4-hydroxyacetophenone monooxygenase